MEFRLLGPFEVFDDQGAAVDVPGRRPRALLAVLLLHPGAVVATSRLISALWSTPPAAARESVQYFVHQLRTVLRRSPGESRRDSMLETHGSGYLLRVEPEQVDVHRFGALAGEARAAGTPALTWERYQEALALWHGPALPDFTGDPFAELEVGRLEALRLTCVEEQFRAGLALGRHAELAGELEALVAEHPVREGLRELLMLALYRSGRQAQALAAYQAAREVSVRRLGVEPGAALQHLQRQVLAQDPALDRPPGRPQDPSRTPSSPTPSMDLSQSLYQDYVQSLSPHPPEAHPPEAPPQHAAPAGSAHAAPAGPAPVAAAGPAPVAAAVEPAARPSAPAAPPPEPVPPPAARVREERKVVTVLVAGVPHLDAGTSGADPEDVRDRSSAVADQIAERVRHYGGIVQPAPDDRVLAVFGADRSREDDPERAVRAALDIHASLDAAGVPHARAGLATGQVVITFAERPPAPAGTAAPHDQDSNDQDSNDQGSPDQGPPGREGSGQEPVQVVGDVLLAAAALEASGPPGAVLVGAGTYRATSQMIDYQPSVALGQVFGVEVWQALGPRARTGARLVDGRAAGPLVERDRELGLLASLLQRLLREREPQLLTLVSEAGLGKSRLVAELGRLVDRAPELVSWRVGQSPAYGPSSLRALAEIVRAHAGILDTDSVTTADAKLQKAVDGAIPDRQQAEQIVAQVRLLLGSGAAPPAPGPSSRPSQEMFAGWAQLLSALAAERPLVVVLEDLQWADDLLLDFVDGLVTQVADVPLLVVATTRVELLDRRQGWGGGKRNAATLSLSPLTRAGTTRLLDALLDGEPLDADTRAQLITASGGNPLYVEEYVRMLRERPAGTPSAEQPLAIPETVQQVIAARIDTLPAGDKRLLQDIAVLGEVGWVGALAAIAGRDRAEVEAGLRRLERREFLRRVRVASVAGETEHAFRHVLIRDVAYQQVLRAERIEKHRRAARWLESITPDRAAGRAELLAHHYGQALELARAADQEVGDLAERARLAFHAAGDHASTVGAYAAAARHYAAALDLWPEDHPDRPDLLFRLGLARVYGEHAGEAELLAARDGYTAAGDTTRVAEVELQLSQLAKLRGDAKAMAVHLERALGTGREPDDEDLEGSLFKAIDQMLMDRYTDAVAGALDVARRAGKVGQPQLEGAGMGVAGQARIDSGDPAGIEEMRQGIAAMDAHAHPTAGLARYGLAWALWWYGDLAECQRAIDEGLPGVEGTATVRWMRAVQAGVDCAAGRWEAAASLLDQVIAGEDTTTVDHVSPFCLLLRARIRLGRGDAGGALADVEMARPAADANPSPRQAQFALALRGRILLAAGDREAAAARLAALLDAQHADPATARVMPEQAELLVELGEPASALPGGLVPSRWHAAALAFAGRDFARAARLYEEIGATVDAAAATARITATS